MMKELGSSSAALNQVRNHLAFGQTHAASQIVEALLEKDALNISFIATKALVCFKKGEFSEARELWQGIVNQSPNSQHAREALLCLAVLSADLGKYSESEGLFDLYKKTATKKNLKHGSFSVACSHFETAKRYATLRDLSESIKSAQNALKAYPAFIEVYLFLARLYLKSNQPVKAIGELTKALDHDSENFDVWLLLGKARLLEGSTREARSSLTRAKSLRPGSSLPDVLLQSLQKEQGRTQGYQI